MIMTFHKRSTGFINLVCQISRIFESNCGSYADFLDDACSCFFLAAEQKICKPKKRSTQLKGKGKKERGGGWTIMANFHWRRVRNLIGYDKR